MKVVLDTNVVISGLLFGGLPGQLLELVSDGEIEAATSPALDAEVERALQAKFPQRLPAIQETLAVLREVTCQTFPRETISAIPKDPDDNRVLECAVSAEADAIVSGDWHLLALSEFRGIPILSPQAFLDHWPRKR